MKNIIYGLKDPRNDLFYYIGKSTVGKDRSIQHLTKSHSTKVNEWIEELKENWVYPDITIIEEVDDLNELKDKEIYWINYYYDLNPNLLNIQDIKKDIENIRKDSDDEEFSSLLRIITEIPNILKRERIVRGISQQKLAEEMNISRTTISLLENGENCSFGTLKKYAITIKGYDLLHNNNRQRV